MTLHDRRPPSSACGSLLRPPEAEREGGPMARRTVLPLSLALAAATAASFGAGGFAGAADMAGVMVRDSSYTPAHQTIQAGETVVFARAQNAELPHTITSDTGNFDQDITEARYVGLRFHQPGTYAFHCKHHGSP